MDWAARPLARRVAEGRIRNVGGSGSGKGCLWWRRRGSEEETGGLALRLGGGAEQREAVRGVGRVTRGVEGLPAGPAKQRGPLVREGFEAGTTVVTA